MPLNVDHTAAPRLLIYRYTGAAPSPEEQANVRQTLIAAGHLTGETLAVMDLRALQGMPTDEELKRTVALAMEDNAWPVRRAYVVLPWMHLPVIRAIESLTAGTITMAAFLTEQDALDWLQRLP
jgi:hypothetical protein